MTAIKSKHLRNFRVFGLRLWTLFRLMAYISSSCTGEEGSPNSQNNFNNYQEQLFCSHVKLIDDKLIELSLSLIHTQKLFSSHFTKFISYQPFWLFPTESEPKITQTLCSHPISGLIKDLWSCCTCLSQTCVHYK